MKNQFLFSLLLFICGVAWADNSAQGYYIHPSQKESHEKDLQAAHQQRHLIERFVARFLANKMDILCHHLPKDLPEGTILSDLQMLEIKIKAYRKTPLELLPEDMRAYVKFKIEYLDKKERHKSIYHPEKSKKGTSYTYQKDKEKYEQNAAFEKKFGCSWISLEAAANGKIIQKVTIPLGEQFDMGEKGVSEEYVANKLITTLNEVSEIGVEQYLKKHPELTQPPDPAKKKAGKKGYYLLSLPFD